MRAALLSLFFFLFAYTLSFAQERFTVSGYVKEKGSGELLLGVTVYIPKLDVGVVTNAYGFYSLSIPEGDYKITFSSVGYAPLEKPLALDKDRALHVALAPSVSLLEAVEVVAESENYESQRVQMSKITLKPKTIQDLPSLLGEKDVMRLADAYARHSSGLGALQRRVCTGWRAR